MPKAMVILSLLQLLFVSIQPVLAETDRAAPPGTDPTRIVRDAYEVVLLPLAAGPASPGGVDKIHTQIISMFARKHLRVVPMGLIQDFLREHNIGDWKLSRDDTLRKIAASFRAKYVISGAVTEYKAEKKYKTGGGVVGGILGGIAGAAGAGWTLYAHCGLDITVYAPESNRFILKRGLTRGKKRQVIGGLLAEEPVLNEAVAAACHAIFNGFLNRLNPEWNYRETRE